MINNLPDLWRERMKNRRSRINITIKKWKLVKIQKKWFRGHNFHELFCQTFCCQKIYDTFANKAFVFYSLVGFFLLHHGVDCRGFRGSQLASPPPPPPKSETLSVQRPSFQDISTVADQKPCWGMYCNAIKITSYAYRKSLTIEWPAEETLS